MNMHTSPVAAKAAKPPPNLATVLSAYRERQDAIEAWVKLQDQAAPDAQDKTEGEFARRLARNDRRLRRELKVAAVAHPADVLAVIDFVLWHHCDHGSPFEGEQVELLKQVRDYLAAHASNAAKPVDGIAPTGTDEGEPLPQGRFRALQPAPRPLTVREAQEFKDAWDHATPEAQGEVLEMLRENAQRKRKGAA